MILGPTCLLHLQVSVQEKSELKVTGLREIVNITEIVDIEIKEAKIVLLVTGMVGDSSKLRGTMPLTTQLTRICPISLRGSSRVIMLRSLSWSWTTGI